MMHELEKLQCIWQEPATLGEGPLWVERQNALFWVDIVNKKLHRLGLADNSRRSWIVDEQITGLAERQDGGLVAAVRDGFAWVDFDEAAPESPPVVTAITLPESDLTGNRFNDAKTDSRGRFWAGSMDEDEKKRTGILYRLDPDLRLQVMDRDYYITNGPAFSPDGRTMYHTDTIERRIYAFDLDPDGRLSDKRIWVQLNEKELGVPDGMTVDSEGCIWLCHFGGARITRFTPDGEIERVVEMPVPNVTSCTFGGAGLDTLFITTARLFLDPETLRRHPLAGSLFALKPGVVGLPTPQFAGRPDHSGRVLAEE